MMAGSDHQERESGFDLNVEENTQTVKTFRRKAVLTDVVCLATLVCAAALVGPGRHARWGLYVFFAFPILLLLDLLLYFLTFRRCPSCGRAFWHSGQWAARPFVWRWMRCPDCGFTPRPDQTPAPAAHRSTPTEAAEHAVQAWKRRRMIRLVCTVATILICLAGYALRDHPWSNALLALALAGLIAVLLLQLSLPRLRRLAAPAQKCLGLHLQPMRIPDRLIVRVHADAPSARCEGSIS